ncbi:MAG: hypothetical protein IPI85_09705 [Dehalococcoidia bacterium]|nr:hypothetical protein [Dehalococcoidia bacterium]
MANGATCGPVTNSVPQLRNPYTGTVVATDIIDVEGCGNINWNKANGVLDIPTTRSTGPSRSRTPRSSPAVSPSTTLEPRSIARPARTP